MTTRVSITEYTVTGLPEDDVNRQVWSIQIAWRGPGDVWAIVHLSSCYSTEGGWDWEPSPSNRDDEYKATHRFTLEEAMALAPVAYDSLIVNGLWVRDGRLVRADA